MAFFIQPCSLDPPTSNNSGIPSWFAVGDLDSPAQKGPSTNIMRTVDLVLWFASAPSSVECLDPLGVQAPYWLLLLRASIYASLLDRGLKSNPGPQAMIAESAC